MVLRTPCVFFLFALAPAFAAEGDFWIESRGIEIPITIEMPDLAAGERAPLVVLVHGHGGTRQENGAFSELALLLSSNGIASVRMDFPGCGDSTEEFTRNNIANMLLDVEASSRFALNQDSIDPGRIGILGYSMGGRLAMLSTIDRFSTMVLWAPVASNGPEPMFNFFGGQDSYNELRAQAEENSAAVYTTPWGQRQTLGLQWFLDMEQSTPLDAARSFEGPVLILHGSGDATISPDNGVAASDAFGNARLDIIDGAGHGFGFFNDKPDARAYLLAETVAFFKVTLAAD